MPQTCCKTAAAARQRAFAEVDRISSTIDPLAADRIVDTLGM